MKVNWMFRLSWLGYMCNCYAMKVNFSTNAINLFLPCSWLRGHHLKYEVALFDCKKSILKITKMVIYIKFSIDSGVFRFFSIIFITVLCFQLFSRMHVLVCLFFSNKNPNLISSFASVTLGNHLTSRKAKHQDKHVSFTKNLNLRACISHTTTKYKNTA